MFPFSLKVRNNKALYSPMLILRIIDIFFLILLTLGLISVINDDSYNAEAIIPTIIILLLFLCLFYQDSWIFDKEKKEAVYIWGFGPFVKKEVFSFSEIRTFQITHFIKGISDNALSQKASWKHKAQVVFSFVTKDEKTVKIEIAPEKKSKGRVEKVASYISVFTSIPLNKDRESEE